MTPVLAFVGSAALVVAAGAALSRYADAIADRTGVGRVWIGSVLLAGATSLPELATDVSAVRLGSADLAAGDLFGSSMANMLILALVDLAAPHRKVLRTVTLDHALAACLAVALTAVALLLVVLRPAGAWLGVVPPSAPLVLLYALGTRAIYRHVSGAASAPPPRSRASPSSDHRRSPTLARAICGFTVAAAVICLAAPAFARSAIRVAALTGLGNGVVGAWLVGFATSLPELVTSVAAVRIGALDLAVGNLFGSNGFNMVIFAALDVVSPSGSVFAALAPVQLVTGLLGVALTSLGLAAVVYRAERRFAMIEPGAVLVVAAYVAGLAVIGWSGSGR